MTQDKTKLAVYGADKPVWRPVIAIGLSTFAVVTTEMLPIGLLTPMAASFGSPVGAAGLAISLPALLAGLFAPVVLVVSGGMDRRRILIRLLILLVLANLACAVAPSIGWLLAARILVGFCMGGVWAIAGGLAPRLVPQPSQGMATAVIFGGVAAASVFGVPTGALISDLADWRTAFGVMAAFSGLVLLLNLWALPPLPVRHSVRPRQFVELLGRPSVRLGLGITLLLVAGHFMAYTFVRPSLQMLSGIPTHWVGLLLFAYGAAGVAGNFIAGALGGGNQTFHSRRCLMEPHERKLALDALSATMVEFHADQPMFTSDELAALSDRDAKYVLADLQEAVRGMNEVELCSLSSALEGRGLSLTKLVLENVSITGSIARKKVWSEADLILLSASREVLPSDVRERLSVALGG